MHDEHVHQKVREALDESLECTSQDVSESLQSARQKALNANQKQTLTWYWPAGIAASVTLAVALSWQTNEQQSTEWDLASVDPNLLQDIELMEDLEFALWIAEYEDEGNEALWDRG